MTPRRVLIADDDDVDRERVRRMLSGIRPPVEILEASSADETLHMLGKVDVDCLLLDFQLGTINATDMYAKLATNTRRHCPIIVITGNANERTAIQAVRQGFYDYLPKASLNRDQLGSAIEGSVRWGELRAQLCESERRFQQLATMLDLAHDPIFAWTDKDGIEFWNRGSEQLYGYSRNEALGASSHDLLKTVFSVPLEQFEAELRQHGLWSGEVRHTTKDGRQIIVSSQHQMLCVGDRALVLEANRDITDQKKAEELNLQSQKMESLGTLAGGVAHDFNNILLAISGHCGLAAKAIRPGHPAQQNLTEIGNASDRAAQLVRRILLFARQEEPKRGIVKLEDIVSEALSLMRASLPAMIEIRSTYASGLRAISADSTQIHQLLVNVLTNSAHAIGNRPGAIDVTVSRASGLELKAEHPELTENEYICLMISDDGCGIEPAILKRIFDPFFTTKSVGQGTGLGLSAVHGILASHCGAVDVKSKVGVGTALRVYFPAAGSSAPSVSRPKQTHEQGYGEHILYVDDEVVIAQLMTTILQRMNYRVTCFTDPEHALRAFQKDPTAYQAVITDLSMPHMTGFDLARAIRLISTRIPILLTSGCIRAEDEIAAQALGIEEVLLKPDSIERLSSALVRAIRGVKV